MLREQWRKTMLRTLRSLFVLASLLVIMLAAFLLTMSLPGGQASAQGRQVCQGQVVCRTVCSHGACHKVCH